MNSFGSTEILGQGLPSDLGILKANLSRILGNTLSLDIVGKNALLLIARVQGIQRQIQQMKEFSDIEGIRNELVALLISLRMHLQGKGSNTDMPYLVFEQKINKDIKELQAYCIHIVDAFLSHLTALEKKISNFEELQTRWSIPIQGIRSKLEDFRDIIENCIYDAEVPWFDARKSFDTVGGELTHMSTLIDKYIKLKTRKYQEEKQKEKIQKYASRLRDILFRKDPTGNALLESATIDARMKKIVEFSATIVPDIQEEGNYENKLNHDTPSLEHMERIRKLVEENIIQPPNHYDAAWILKSIARLRETGGNDELLRQEVESALYDLRKKSIPLDLSNMDGRTDLEIKVLTTTGVRIISPGFIEHKNYLFGKTYHNGKWVRCRCNSDSFKVGMPSFIEVFDGDRGLQKVEYIPLVCKRIDRKKSIISTPPENEVANIKTSETIEKPSIAPGTTSPSVTIDPIIKEQISHVLHIRRPFTESANMDNTPGEPLTSMAPPPDIPREQKPPEEKKGFLSLVKDTGRDLSKRFSNWWHKAA